MEENNLYAYTTRMFVVLGYYPEYFQSLVVYPSSTLTGLQVGVSLVPQGNLEEEEKHLTIKGT